MDLIIHDLLELARLGRRELRRQRVNMNQLVKSALEDFEPQLRQRQITWNVDALPDVYGDLNLLRLAFSNLLDNALKYTRQRPRAIIEINTKPAPPNSTQITFYIKDNGTGFDMKQSKKIFDPFERLPQEGEFEGVGIGLANVKRIIQKHGGEIWCDAMPDKGATFYFTLPVTPIAEIAPSNGEGTTDSRGASDG
jgi:signal transduction histidine kinase